jgi:hypothetical protein
MRLRIVAYYFHFHHLYISHAPPLQKHGIGRGDAEEEHRWLTSNIYSSLRNQLGY